MPNSFLYLPDFKSVMKTNKNFLVFFYGVEMSYVNVYLLSLGMSKSLLSFVWIAGPLSGLTMQPIIGVLADSSTSKYGRRRPIMLIGSVIVSLGLCVMAWAKEITSIFNFEEQKVRLDHNNYPKACS